MSNEGEMVAPTENCTWIKDNLNVATKPIKEAIASQGVVVDDISDFNDNSQIVACSSARNPEDSDKEVNVYYILEARLVNSIRDANCNGDVGRPIDPNVMVWSQIKHVKSLIQIQDNWSNPYPFWGFICTMPVIKFL